MQMPTNHPKKEVKAMDNPKDKDNFLQKVWQERLAEIVLTSKLNTCESSKRGVYSGYPGKEIRYSQSGGQPVELPLYPELEEE